MQNQEEFDKELQKVLNDELPAKGKKIKRKGRWKKKMLISAAGLIGLIFLISKAFGGGTEVSTPVVTQPLTKGSVTETLTLSGPVSGTDSVDVVSNLHLEVLNIAVSEGDRVEKGQILATLDSSSLEREIEKARNTYELAVQARAENQKSRQIAYEKALQTYSEAQKALARADVLHAAGDISSLEWENAKNAAINAQKDVAAYDVVNGQVQMSAADNLQVENARFELENKQKDLENTQIASPIDGTVTRVNSKVGRFADKTEDDKPMFIIENLDQLQLSIRVSEYTIGKVKLGQKAQISADLLNNETVNGVVSMISPSGEEKGDGSTERVIPITISIENQDSGLIPGITAKAKVVLAEAKDTFVVPVSALIQNSNGTLSIAEVQDGKIHLVSVTTGVESDFDTEIFPAEGETLSEGMQYLPNPPQNAAEGLAVTVMPPAAEQNEVQTQTGTDTAVESGDNQQESEETVQATDAEDTSAEHASQNSSEADSAAQVQE